MQGCLCHLRKRGFLRLSDESVKKLNVGNA